MNRLMMLALLMASSDFAGERNVVLSRGSPIDQRDGAFYAGGGSNIRIILNTESSVKVLVESYAVAPNSTVDSIPAEKSGNHGNYFVTASGAKVYVFKQSNCLKGQLTAILMSGSSTISNCTQIASDRMEGSDYDFCD